MFDKVHLDMWGPYGVITVGGFSYFLTVVDDHKRCTWIYLMKINKSDARSIIRYYYQFVFTQLGYKVKCFPSDNSPKFHMLDFYFEHDIIHQTSCVDTPQQNRVVERKHQYFINVARSFLSIQCSFKVLGSFCSNKNLSYQLDSTPLLKHTSPFELLF